MMKNDQDSCLNELKGESRMRFNNGKQLKCIEMKTLIEEFRNQGIYLIHKKLSGIALMEYGLNDREDL
jgi:hypothetical protein